MFLSPSITSFGVTSFDIICSTVLHKREMTRQQYQQQ